ncbi:hypothetical protein BpHYR1_003552 [Brachionus plicatilis]|uniref:Uncharacterized protein n=1 Tax=Brachionus plicatilis TaxID=10195 RepID=A0A3M7QEJ2_BRAPC|nr:hypothetical protein BpHYR1_003552 [Brachionus plicatilis]
MRFDSIDVERLEKTCAFKTTLPLIKKKSKTCGMIFANTGKPSQVEVKGLMYFHVLSHYVQRATIGDLSCRPPPQASLAVAFL